ncbi:TonB-dependent receptor domain-containing protein [Colwellia sp. Bg11-28]|uniref:TonB-dependent receptor domain-containing protein n=1 Tax=Colwellia sp. Bg11-28 TaxID=2058305 RepID=UPI000C344E49|nr:TonB-dependent receptor [Colwellia sp. Bg11-28]PKH85122.1 TonB-dependent receptor [Colwellia sp. Bg11-28]
MIYTPTSNFFIGLNTIKSVIFNSVLVVSFFLSSTSFAQEFDFELTAGTLNNMLLSIAKQANMQLVMRANVEYGEDNKRYKALKQQSSLDDLLSQVLRDSPFNYQILVDTHVILILPKTVVAPENSDALEVNRVWEHILVTGHGSENRNLLSSSTSVSYISSGTLQQLSNENTAELLQNVPGFWVEGSGGETNNNVAPRGLRGGEGFRFISLMEDGIPIVYDGVWPDFFLRQDLMTQGIETIRGGSSGIFTFNGPAAIVNFITAKGSEKQVNRLKLSQGLDHHFTRLDGLTSGAINEQWFYAFGGFYRQSDGVREPGYTADQGGQFKVNLTRKTKAAEMNFSYRFLDDKTSFFSPTPMTNANSPQGVTGIDASYGTLLSADFNNLTFKSPEGSFQRDIEDGQQSKLHRFNASIDWDVAEKILLKNKFSVADMENTMYALINLGNDTLLDAAERLKQKDITDFINQQQSQGATQPAYVYSHSQQIISNPADLNSNGLITTAYPLYSHYQQKQWLNHFSVNVDLDEVQVSLGHMFAYNDFGSLPLDKWQGEILTEVKDQPRRLDIVALDDRDNVVASFSEQGFTSYAGPGYLDGEGEAISNSIYGYLEWQPITPLLLDFGLRWEHLSLTSTAGTDSVYALADSNFDAVYKSGYTFTKNDDFNKLAWNLGGNYQLSPLSAIFFHLSSGFEMPKLINFGNEIGWGDYQDTIPEEAGFGDPVELTFAEGGVRLADNNWRITAALFETRFNPLPFTVFRGIYDRQQSIFIDTKTRGIEFDFTVNLTKQLTVAGLGVWQKAVLSGIPSDAIESAYNGNQITRTPEFQLRISPSYTIDKARFFLTYAYIGKRYSDIANNFSLAAYSVIDLGFTYQLTKQFSFALHGKNITNSVGLTEGNPRNALAHRNSTNFYARAIFGRSVIASVEVTF